MDGLERTSTTIGASREGLPGHGTSSLSPSTNLIRTVNNAPGRLWRHRGGLAHQYAGLTELHYILTRRLGCSRADAEQILSELDFSTVTTDPQLVRRAASTAGQHQLSIFDALVLEAATLATCDDPRQALGPL